MDDDDLERMREQRLRQMKKMHQQKIQLKRLGHGTYTEVHNEREFFEAGKKSKLVACHFYRPMTKHCLVVDKHFQKLCKNILVVDLSKSMPRNHLICARSSTFG